MSGLQNTLFNCLDGHALINFALTSKSNFQKVKEYLNNKVVMVAVDTLSNILYANEKPQDLSQEMQIFGGLLHPALENKTLPVLIHLSNQKEAKFFKEMGLTSSELIIEHDLSYQRICRNILSDKKIEEKIKNLPKGYDFELLCQLEKGDWEAIKKGDRDNFAYQALDLFRQGKITTSQFATCMFFWSLIQDFDSDDIAIVPLFVGEQRNPVAVELVTQTLEEKWPGVNKSHAIDVFKKIQDKPECEKYLFFIKDQDEKSNHTTVTQRLHEIDFNLLGQCELRKQVTLEEQKRRSMKKKVKNEKEYEDVQLNLKKRREQSNQVKKRLEKLKFLIQEDKKKLKKLELSFKFMCDFGAFFEMEKHENGREKELLKELEELIKTQEMEYAKMKMEWKKGESKLKSDEERFAICNPIANNFEKIEENIYTLLQKYSLGTEGRWETWKGRMCPSLSMMQSFVESISGEDAITFVPVIGLSSITDIENNGRRSTRDIALPFPNTKLPETADTFAAPYSIDFFYHDFYHGCKASQGGKELRESIMSIIDLIRNSNLKMHQCPEFVELLIDGLIDMELISYHEFSGSVVAQDLKTMSLIQHLNILMKKALGMKALEVAQSIFEKESSSSKAITIWTEEFVQLLIENGLINKNIDSYTNKLLSILNKNPFEENPVFEVYLNIIGK